MIINIKNFSRPFALGLRWLVATRNEVDYLKDKENLSYGFVNSTQAHSKSNYKAVVLTGNEHDNAVSLAGILADKYENLIFVHQIQPDLFWVCIIKKHEVWNDLDLGDRTAGDYICTKESADEIIKIAQDIFIENEIAYTKITYASTQAMEAFPQYQHIKLSDLLLNTKKSYKKYRIAWLQSHRKKIKRITTFLVILIVVVSGSIYLYSSQNAAAREKARILHMQMEQKREEQARLSYITGLESRINQNQGSRAIAHVLRMVGRLSLQSAGWSIQNISYSSDNSELLSIELNRGQYGDILSFQNSYLSNTIQENISSNNDSGSKILSFSDKQFSIPMTRADKDKIAKIISKPVPTVRYKLIAYGQRMQLNLTTGPIEKDQYHYNNSSFSIDGEDIWNLRKIEFILKQFPTITVDNIDMKISTDNKIAWSLKGKIYG